MQKVHYFLYLFIKFINAVLLPYTVPCTVKNNIGETKQ